MAEFYFITLLFQELPFHITFQVSSAVLPPENSPCRSIILILASSLVIANDSSMETAFYR